MGAYSTDDLMSADLRMTIEKTIVEPTLLGLAADGIRYQGFLYIGLMLTQRRTEGVGVQLPVR